MSDIAYTTFSADPSDTTIDVNTDAYIGNVLYIRSSEQAGSSEQPAVKWVNSNGDIVGEICVSEDGYMRLITHTDNGKVCVLNSPIICENTINDYIKSYFDNYGNYQNTNMYQQLIDRISALENR